MTRLSPPHRTIPGIAPRPWRGPARVLGGVALLCASLLAPCHAGFTPPPAQPARAAPAIDAATVRQDMAALARYRRGLIDTLRYLQQQRSWFEPGADGQAPLLTHEQRADLRRAWQRVLDYTLALDALAQRHGQVLPGKPRDQQRFALGYQAYIAQYRQALDVLALLQRNRWLDTWLNEPDQDSGLPADSYRDFKYRFLHVARASRFAAYQSTLPLLRQPLPDSAREDAQAIWQHGRDQGTPMTIRHGRAMLGKQAFDAWFPVQAGVAEWMGDAKVWRTQRNLIKPAQARALLPRMQPGDILLERREWYVSNIGLPGFWPHAALYVGTPAERAPLRADPAVRAWVQQQGEASGNLERLLERAYPAAYTNSLQVQDQHPRRILEAVSEGVVFNSYEHTMDADSVAVLRPRLSARDKAIAIWRAWGYAGRPYDFNFDFVSDQSLVCTELIYKAYEPQAGDIGLGLTLTPIAGRPAMPANQMVQQFDRDWGSPAQRFDLVFFLDGFEAARGARPADVTAFRASWKRPKWYTLSRRP